MSIPRHSMIRLMIAALFAVACCACTPQTQLLFSLIPDGTIPLLLGHFEQMDETNRRRIAAFEKQRDWSGLAKFADENIKADPSTSDWWLVAGYAHAQLGDRKRAIECYTEVVRLTPDDILGWNLLAQSYRLTGEPERAVQIANRALNVRRDSHETWFLLGESYSDLRRLELAVKAYREAIQLEEQYAAAWLGLGKAYARLGRTAELTQVRQILEKLDPAMARELPALPAAPK